MTSSRKPGEKKSHQLQKWIHDFIDDREEIPTCHWKTSGRSLINDEDFSQEIHAHLQSLKPSEVRVEAIVRFLDTPEMLARLKRKKTISVETAQRWMKKMGYRWTYDPKGQYVDGHERNDVVDYRQDIFLPAMRGCKIDKLNGIQRMEPKRIHHQVHAVSLSGITTSRHFMHTIAEHVAGSITMKRRNHTRREKATQ